MFNKIKLFFSNKKKVLILSSFITICLFTTLYFYLISNPKNLKVIPKEAQAVIVIDPVSILQKGNFQQILEINGIKNIKEKSEDNEIAKKLKQDLNYTGINITSDIFGYLIIDNNAEVYRCLSLSIKCADKFEKSFGFLISQIQDVFQTENDQLKFKIKTKKSFKYAVADNNKIALAWDNEKAVIVQPILENNFLKNKAIELMELKQEDQIINSQEFNNFYDNKKELSIWLSTENLDGLKQQLNSIYSEFKNEISNNIKSKKQNDDLNTFMDNVLKNNYVSMFLSFEENYVSFKISSSLNNSMQKLVDDYNIMNNNFNEKLLDYFPNENIFLTTISLNQKKYLQIIDKFFNYLEEMNPNIKGLLPFNPNNDLLNTFNESMIFTVHGLDTLNVKRRDYKNDKYYFTDDGFDYYIEEAYTFENIKIPKFSCAFDIKDKEKFLTYLDTSNVNKEFSNVYYTQYVDGVPFYFHLNNNNIIFITNDTERIVQFASNEQINSDSIISNTNNAIKIKKNYLYGKLDILNTFKTAGKYLQFSIDENINKIKSELNTSSKLSDVKKLKKNLNRLKKAKNNFVYIDEEINKFANKIGENIEYEFSDINTFEIRLNTPVNGKNSLNNLSLALAETLIYLDTFKTIKY